jgi:hypothetical protein
LHDYDEFIYKNEIKKTTPSCIKEEKRNRKCHCLEVIAARSLLGYAAVLNQKPANIY